LILPKTPDHIKIGYTEKQLEWCKENKKNIWAFLIENKLLYSSGSTTFRKFFTDGPFTHEFSKDSPARIGEWVGWQIVRTYMNKHPDIKPSKLFSNNDAQEILMKSGYKP